MPEKSEWKSLMVNVAELKEGSFYKIYTDSNASTLLLEEIPEAIQSIRKEFVSVRYLEIAFYGDKNIQVFEKIASEDIELHNLINGAVEIRVRKLSASKNLCIVQSNRPITGYIILK